MLARVLAGTRLCVARSTLPGPGATDILIQIAYAGINRLDLLQLRGTPLPWYTQPVAGQYPPPQGAPEILGVEVSGVVKGAGAKTSGRFRPGDRVVALLSGGGYADHVVVDEKLCLPVPEGLSLEEAGAIPENWITAYQLTRLAGPVSCRRAHHARCCRLERDRSCACACSCKRCWVKLGPTCKSASTLRRVSKKMRSQLHRCASIIALCGSPEKQAFAKALGTTQLQYIVVRCCEV